MGPPKKDFTFVGGAELGPYEDLKNVLRILAMGGAICLVLRGFAVLGGSGFNGLKRPAGSRKERPRVRGGS